MDQNVTVTEGSTATEDPGSDSEYCISSCTVQDQAANLDMVRCCLCARWYHLKCVSLPSDEVGVWPCPNCRNIAGEVQSTKHDIKNLTVTIDKLTEMMKVQSENYQAVKRLLETKIHNLEKENTTLEEKNTELENKLRAPSLNSREPTNSSSSKTLVIGSSLLRNFDEKKLEETEVRSLSGARINDIAVELETLLLTAEIMIAS